MLVSQCFKSNFDRLLHTYTAYYYKIRYITFRISPSVFHVEVTAVKTELFSILNTKILDFKNKSFSIIIIISVYWDFVSCKT